jgi:hypothetical protein
MSTRISSGPEGTTVEITGSAPVGTLYTIAAVSLREVAEERLAQLERAAVDARAAHYAALRAALLDGVTDPALVSLAHAVGQLVRIGSPSGWPSVELGAGSALIRAALDLRVLPSSIRDVGCGSFVREYTLGSVVVGRTYDLGGRGKVATLEVPAAVADQAAAEDLNDHRRAMESLAKL